MFFDEEPVCLVLINRLDEDYPNREIQVVLPGKKQQGPQVPDLVSHEAHNRSSLTGHHLHDIVVPWHTR
jgi:hypothetical protein